MIKKLFLGAAVIATVAIAYVTHFILGASKIAAGYVAQTYCTNVIMLGRDKADITANDLSDLQRKVTSSEIYSDYVATQFNVGPIALRTRYALHRPGLGCSIVVDSYLDELRQQGIKGEFVSPTPSNWPEVNKNLLDVDYKVLNQGLDAAFYESTSQRNQQQFTRAVIVHYRGHIIAERYADDWAPNIPHRAMSVTKSFSSAVTGALVQDGKLAINSATGLDGWSKPNSLKSNVTLAHILNMTSGFAYQEEMESDPLNVLNRMLYAEKNAGAYAAQQALDKEAGSFWDYQTTNSVLLQYIARKALNDDQQYFRYAQEKLFNKLGMGKSFFQADSSGTFLGGASLYATARDFTRLGLLYLHDGVINGERIFPEGWVDFTRTPSKASMQRNAYGAQFWLNAPSKNQ